jgi:hypothetical protein
MKAFLLAVVSAVAIAALSFGILTFVQKSSSSAFTTESVRVGEAGHNLLVGERISGRARQGSPNE